jgi:hypothetical protein
MRNAIRARLHLCTATGVARRPALQGNDLVRPFPANSGHSSVWPNFREAVIVAEKRWVATIVGSLARRRRLHRISRNGITPENEHRRSDEGE